MSVESVVAPVAGESLPAAGPDVLANLCPSGIDTGQHRGPVLFQCRDQMGQAHQGSQARTRQVGHGAGQRRQGNHRRQPKDRT